MRTTFVFPAITSINMTWLQFVGLCKQCATHTNSQSSCGGHVKVAFEEEIGICLS